MLSELEYQYFELPQKLLMKSRNFPSVEGKAQYFTFSLVAGGIIGLGHDLVGGLRHELDRLGLASFVNTSATMSLPSNQEARFV